MKPSKTPAYIPTELETQILGVCISDFDQERFRTRRHLVNQRFVLGLVDMFEAFPALKSVDFNVSENVASMISLPPLEQTDCKDQAEHMALTTKVRKSLQKARAAISPQSRDTREALVYFFYPACENNIARLDRYVFTRENLPVLCAPEQRLTLDLLAKIKSNLLLKIANQSSSKYDGLSTGAPKL